MIKRCGQRIRLTMLLIGAVANLFDPSQAAEMLPGVQPAELAQWERGLRNAGASPAEIQQFDDLLRRQTPENLKGWLEYLRSVPTSFFGEYLKGERLRAREEAREQPTPVFPGATPVRSCESLRNVSIQDTTIDSVEIAASDGSCRVTATVMHPPATNRIRVFIALPTKTWNGRFRGTGGGGYAGGSSGSLDGPASKGYAVGATDTGNEQGTASFAIDAQGRPAWQRMRDNAYIGIHDMTVVGKALTEAFYGRPPRYSYFVGGSTGGRQALTEAQRYPQDYDGILAINPAIARDRYVPAQLWPQVVMHEANNFLSEEKREAATAAAVKACDGADGVVDGVIDDPTRCDYDPTSLVGTLVGQGTFTSTDARLIREIWDGPRAHDGSFLWWGPTRGTDLTNFADSRGTPLTGKPCEEGLDWFRYFVTLDPDWDWRTLTRGEFELLFEQSIQTHASTYGGDDPDLSRFRDRKGRLLIVHGTADQYVPHPASIAYYKKVQRRIGSAEQTAQFARLFLAPGVDHGFSGAGPSPTGLINALVDWVEEGKAPERITAESLDRNGRVIRTRPLFPYPQVAKYKGSGSTDDAANFIAQSPAD